VFLLVFLQILIRPPDMHVGGLMFYHGFFFFIRLSVFELAEQNLTISGHMVGIKCNLKMHVRNVGYPFPYKSGAQIPPFSMILQLKG